MPLSDGTNAEKEEPSPPIEWKGPDDLKDVILYQKYNSSPPSAKVRWYLKYFKINYQSVKQFAPGPYKKSPSIVVNGRQVNDSMIIVKYLSKALFGSFDEEFEKKLVYETHLALEVEFTANPGECKTLLVKSGDLPGCLSCLASPILKKVGVKIKKENPDLKPLVEYFREFRAEIGEKQFWAGDKIGQQDLSFYGSFSVMRELEIGTFVNASAEAGLDDWFKRMDQAVTQAVGRSSKPWN